MASAKHKKQKTAPEGAVFLFFVMVNLRLCYPGI